MRVHRSTTTLFRAVVVGFVGSGIALFVPACDAADPTQPPPPPPPQNLPPVASSGGDLTVSARLPVKLDGSTSADPDGDPITYQWSLASVPTGSQATLDDPTLARPTFTPDLPGTYGVQLIVSDGVEQSAPAQSTVSAQDQTVSATIGAGGGTLTAGDGGLTLDVPAGALTSPAQITMTRVTRAQWPAELAEPGDFDVVYDLQPSGLSFATPAQATFTMAADGVPAGSLDSIPADAARTELPLGVVTLLSNGQLEAATNQAVERGPDGAGLRVTADVSHFTFVAHVFIKKRAAPGVLSDVAVVRADVPAKLNVGETKSILVDLFTRVEVSRTTGKLADMSMAPLALAPPVSDFKDTFSPVSLIRQLVRNTYTCLPPGGTGIFRVRVAATFNSLPDGFPPPPVTLSGTLVAPVECEAPPPPPPPPTKVINVTAPSGLSVIPTVGGDRLIAVAREGGADVFALGDTTDARAFSIDPAAGRIYGVGGTGNDALMAITPTGIYLAPGPPIVPGSGQTSGIFTKVNAPGLNNDGNTTDMCPWGNDPTESNYVITQFDERSLVFAEFADGDLVIDPNAQLLFTDAQGNSAFGTDFPVSACAGPRGVSDADTLLVATVAGDGSGASTLWEVENNGGIAIATPVLPAAFPEVRRLRCLGDTGLCAVSSFGTGVGFGGVMTFSTDGQGGYLPLDHVIGRTIGLDVRLTARNTALFGWATFEGNTFNVLELSLIGELLDATVALLPPECTGAEDFKWVDDVSGFVSCSTSDRVVPVSFNPGP